MIARFLACMLLTAPLAAEMNVLAVSGSTREESYNKKLLEAAAAIAREKGASVTIIDLKEYPLPFYDADFESSAGLPENAKRLRSLLKKSDLVLIASPEYNHSVSGILKNALDWASRDEAGNFSRDAFEGRRFAIMSASPGKKGGVRGLVHLNDILEDLHAEIVPAQTAIGRAHEVVATENGFNTPALKQEMEVALGVIPSAKNKDPL